MELFKGLFSADALNPRAAKMVGSMWGKMPLFYKVF